MQRGARRLCSGRCRSCSGASLASTSATTGWLVGCQLVGWLAHWLPGWLAGWLAGLLAGWLPGWLACWLAGRLAGWLVGWLAAWLAGSRADWLAAWLAGSLAGRLVGRGWGREHGGRRESINKFVLILKNICPNSRSPEGRYVKDFLIKGGGVYKPSSRGSMSLVPWMVMYCLMLEAI